MVFCPLFCAVCCLSNHFRKPTLTLLLFQDRKKFISHREFHQGSFDIADSSNLLDIINDSDYGLGLGSLDSSDMFPTQGSLCGLERLALETMGPAGSMSNMTNSVYINPFPPRHSQESLALRDRHQTVSRPRTSQVGGAGLSQ